MLQNRQCKKEEQRSERRKQCERSVETAMKFLARTAARAFSQMLLVILAHFRRNSGNIVPPACQDGSYHSVSATLLCRRHKDPPAKGLTSTATPWPICVTAKYIH
jgi:hypothetical protein